MRIRSITYFDNPSNPINPEILRSAGAFLRVAQPTFVHAGYEVQSTRLASVPFAQLLPEAKLGALADYAVQLEKAGEDAGFGYMSLGPALPAQLVSYDLIPEALAATRNVFFGGSMTAEHGQIELEAVRRCAQVIKNSSTLSPDGFANLRFAALANVPAGSPFFPAAYHHGDQPCFALATEAADLAVTTITPASSLEEAHHNLVDLIDSHGRALTRLAREIEQQIGVKFSGIDFSLAPFPEEGRSLGTAMERLGVSAVGTIGSLAAAAFLADAIDRAEFPRAGFSGLMLPVLEDATLARRVADGRLELTDLLLYSAVCGTGLDILPLPGDTSTEQLYAILLDLASLSSRLGKPLTARLMPIPGKTAGELTGFDFEYFANSRVMSLRPAQVRGLLDGDGSLSLKPRVSR